MSTSENTLPDANADPEIHSNHEVEYVTGWRFTAVAIAIVLSMFLVCGPIILVRFRN
jgi:hypothetical protein